MYKTFVLHTVHSHAVGLVQSCDTHYFSFTSLWQLNFCFSFSYTGHVLAFLLLFLKQNFSRSRFLTAVFNVRASNFQRTPAEP